MISYNVIRNNQTTLLPTLYASKQLDLSIKIFTRYNIFSQLGQLEQHCGGAQQVAGPPATLLISHWQHFEQVSF